MTIVYGIIILLLLIFVHEFGHLLSAKMTGVRVNEFALGMGPKLFGFKKGETLYTFRAIPIGGYCALEGQDEDSDDPRAFNNKPAPKRAFVLFAGSLMNVVLAIVLLSLTIFSMGQTTRVIADVSEDSPSYANGLRAGDEIIAVNGVDIDEWSEITPVLKVLVDRAGSADIDITLTVLRDGAEKNIATNLYENEDGRIRLGIESKVKRTPGLFFKSFYYGVKATFAMSRMMYDVLGSLVTGKAGMDQLTGPVGIFVAVGETAKHGFSSLVQLAALISLNLGIVNLLPFPALDGGRLIFLLIRKITGKAISDKTEGTIHLVGILVLFAFIALITLQDVDRFFIKKGDETPIASVETAETGETAESD